MEVAKEKRASNLFTTFPIDEHGFALNKGAFKDAICLRYGWHPFQLLSNHVCNKQFTVNRVALGGFPMIRHNEVRDITAHLLSSVWHNVGIEPQVQMLREDWAWLDIKSPGFWGE